MGSDEPFQRYGHSKLYKTADGRDLGFGSAGSRDIPSADPENPAVEQTGVDPMIRYRDMAVRSFFPKCEVGRSSVLNIYTLTSCHVLLFAIR